MITSIDDLPRFDLTTNPYNQEPKASNQGLEALPPVGGRSKYHGEQDPRHGGNLYWPGLGGLPVRGTPPPTIKSGEENRATYVADFHVDVFDLSDEKQREKYVWVMDRVVNGLFFIVNIQRFWNEEKRNMNVYLEWIQAYYQWVY